MANKEHVEHLRLKGVDDWNQWRISSPDVKPDLSDRKISDIISNSGKLILDKIDLSYANLKNTSFCGVSLVEAKFCNAEMQDGDLSHTALKNADFTGAKLEQTNFSHSKLIGANFTGAKLEQTNFSHSKLIGANFTNAKPWKAILYPPPHDPSNQHITPTRIQDDVESKPINNISELNSICKALKNHYEQYREEEYVIYFRGECSDSWNLLPSVKRYPPTVEEGEMLFDLLSRQPKRFNDTTMAMAQWVLAQHYGLKTRLLDITRNPLVSLFFASEFHAQSHAGRLHIFAVPKWAKVLSVYYSRFIKPFNSDTISVIANFAKLSRKEQEVILGSEGTSGMRNDDRVLKYDTAMRRLYHFINQERPNFEKRIDIRDLFCVFVVEPQKLFERIRAQSGAFMISAFHSRFEEEEMKKFNNGTPHHHHYRLKIPHCVKKNIRDELELLNITRETLFPSLEETARAINDSHLQRSQST